MFFPSPIWERNITSASHTQSIELVGVLPRPTMAITLLETGDFAIKIAKKG